MIQDILVVTEGWSVLRWASKAIAHLDGQKAKAYAIQDAYPSPLYTVAMPAGAVAMALPGAVPVSPSLAILCPSEGGAVRGLRWLGGMLPM